MAKQFFIFRHGETKWNEAGKFQGSADIPLNETGMAQAKRLIEPLRAQKIQHIVSSDLKRAQQTAKVSADALGLKISTYPELREANLGDAEGKTFKEIERDFGAALLEDWKSNDPDKLDTRYPNGESGKEVLARVTQKLCEIGQSSPHDRIGVSCHGNVIRRLVHSIICQPTVKVHIPNGIMYGLAYNSETGQLEFRPTLAF